MHDKKLADQAAYTLPKGSCLSQDNGFQGFAQESVAILQPKSLFKNYVGILSKAIDENKNAPSTRVRYSHL